MEHLILVDVDIAEGRSFSFLFLFVFWFWLYIKKIDLTMANFDDLTIFLSNDGAFISKKLKNGNPSKTRRVLTEQEIMSFVAWFIREKCKKYGVDEFTLDMDGKSAYKLGLVVEEENKEIE